MGQPRNKHGSVVTDDSALQARSLPSSAGQAARADGESVLSALPGAAGGFELEYPSRLVSPAPRLGHISFSFWLVQALLPRTFIELGVHSGNSYCAFLQAVQALGIDARCFGIDHWRDDEQAGFYGEEVYQELHAYHDPRYGSFSTLVRSTFDDAAPNFSDGSVDLLHLDGCHTYEGASRDFTTWLPKMSTRGVMLFHDTNVHERNFGVWRLWQEIALRYPHFEFIHSHGLGVAYVGSEPLRGPLQLLFKAAEDVAAAHRVRAYFGRLSMSIAARFEVHEAEAARDKHREAYNAELTKARAERVTATMVRARMQAQLAAVEQHLREIENSASWHIAEHLLLFEQTVAATVRRAAAGIARIWRTLTWRS